MHSIVFESLFGMPVAVLLMSSPVAPERTCVFVTAPVDSSAATRESRVLLPGKPTEYACRYAMSLDGTEVAFENQLGWRIEVKLDAGRKGDWSAEKDGERLRGGAFAL